MAILVRQHGEVESATGWQVHSGEGTIIVNGIEMDVKKLDLPFNFDHGGATANKLEVKHGWVCVEDGATSLAIQPNTVSHFSTTDYTPYIESSGINTDRDYYIEAGSGAARLDVTIQGDVADSFYLRLNQLKYPFRLTNFEYTVDGVSDATNKVGLTVLGNSFIGRRHTQRA